MLNNLKIGVRLGIGFAVTLALLITIATVSYRIIGARWRLCDRWCKITA